MLISWHSGPVMQTGRADSPSQKKVPMLAVKVGPQACADVGGAKGSWPDSICCLPRRPHGRNTRSVKMRQNDGAKPDGAWALEPELPARNLVLPRGSSATSGRPSVLWLSFLICTRGEWQYRPPRTAGNIKRDSSSAEGCLRAPLLSWAGGFLSQSVITQSEVRWRFWPLLWKPNFP